MKMEDIKLSLKRRFEEAPEQVIVAGLSVLALSGKIVESFAGASSKRAYAKRMNHSIKKNRH